MGFITSNKGFTATIKRYGKRTHIAVCTKRQLPTELIFHIVIQEQILSPYILVSVITKILNIKYLKAITKDGNVSKKRSTC